MKKILILLIFILNLGYAKGVVGLNQAFDKQTAIANAHWKAFEPILNDLIGQNAYKGSIKKSFKKDFQKDFETFKTEYFDFSTYRCSSSQDDGYLCEVRGNVNLEKIRAILSEKSNQSTTMGKGKLSNLNIVLIDDISTDSTRDFISYLQSDLNDSGNSLTVLSKGSQVGKKGNNCKDIERKLNMFKKKGSSYKSAVEAAERKLEECKENENVEYAFSLNKFNFTNNGRPTNGDIKGTLSYRIIMFNTQKGKRDQAVRPQVVTAYASDMENLKFKLYEKASRKASSHMTSNLLNYIGKKQYNKSSKNKRLSKFNYNYTVILMGITNDGNDRGKRRLIRDAIKKIGAKPQRNSLESSDFEQVYNFGTNEEIDIEDFMDNLYDLSDSTGIPIQISENGNNILNVQFQ